MSPRCGELCVIPAKAGIQHFAGKKYWIPARAALGRNDDNGDNL
jgi:hypothetical protein